MTRRRPRIATIRRRLRKNLRRHLEELGFQRNADGSLAPPTFTKDSLRHLHRLQRAERLTLNKEFIEGALPRFLHHFASGSEVEPSRISARIELVEGQSWQADLFRLASLTWSVPVSQGYGRRMRFLVWDQGNEKLLGIFALMDPVYNLRDRDAKIGWTAKDRKKRLVDVMDAYILGAIPPYNMLLGGKLVACLVRTEDVRKAFHAKYRTKRGIISKTRKHPELVLVTTSSSLGKSSVYDRLKLNGVPYLQPVGYTEGWGHFHISEELFEDMRLLLKKKHHEYANGHQFGDGRSWRMRVVRVALQDLGLDPSLLRHGIRREVYVSRLASNAERVLRGEARPYRRSLLTVQQVSALAVARWMVPRSTNRREYLGWQRDRIAELLDPTKDGSASLVRPPPTIDEPQQAELVPAPAHGTGNSNGVEFA